MMPTARPYYPIQKHAVPVTDPRNQDWVELEGVVTTFPWEGMLKEIFLRKGVPHDSMVACGE